MDEMGDLGSINWLLYGNPTVVVNVCFGKMMLTIVGKGDLLEEKSYP